ncbi:MAG TPA: hypothetical protein VMZ28_16450, partial [Kofleriaceae bacterium]|nr:hypothetical protein [Kofleriaceae bacterium]
MPRRAGRDSGEVAAPAPEDPRLAVSVAYAFGSDRRRTSDEHAAGDGVNESFEVDGALMAPTDHEEAADSIDEDVGDPDNDYTQVEEDDDAGNAERMRLAAEAAARARRPSAPHAPAAAAVTSVDDGNSTLDFPLLEEEDVEPAPQSGPTTASDESVDIAIDEDEAARAGDDSAIPTPIPAPPVLPQAAAPVAPATRPARTVRASTVALADSDLEELNDEESFTAAAVQERVRRVTEDPIFARPASAAGSNGSEPAAQGQRPAAALEAGDSGEIVSDDELSAGEGEGAADASAAPANDGGDFDDRTMEL